MQTNQLVALFVAVLMVIAGYRLTAPYCRRVPGRRALVMVCALAAVGVVALLIPQAGRLTGSVAESPAGIFVILIRVIPLLTVGLLALGAFAAAAWPHHRSAEP